MVHKVRNPSSVYGYMGGSGAINSYVPPCPPAPTCDLLFASTLADLVRMIESTSKVIDLFFPPSIATAPTVSKMGYTASVVASPMFMVWMMWMQTYPDEKIDPTNPDVLNRLEDLYLQMGLSPDLDPFLNP
jgi:hypothetical protein